MGAERRPTCFGIPVNRESGEDIPAGHGETILLVEDEASILKLGRLMLESLGYAVLTAPSPKTAIRLLENQPGTVDLLLTDVVMPGMSGDG